MADNHNAICKSVFKDGTDTTSTMALTQKWVELIYVLEKSKLEKPGGKQ